MKVTIINGGSGAKNIIIALIKNNKYKITSIINTFDDGKSTGIIRKFFDMPGPSDIRKVHYLFLNNKNKNYKTYQKLYKYRFKNLDRRVILIKLKKFVNGEDQNLFNIKLNNKRVNNYLKKCLFVFCVYLYNSEKKKSDKFDFNNCSLMNLCYAGSYIINKKRISETIKEFEKIFSLKGNVICITNKNLYLSALLSNKKILTSEDSIINNDITNSIQKLFLTKIPANKLISETKNNNKALKVLESNNFNYAVTNEVKTCLKKTKLLIFAPGTQFSSLYPTYLSKGFKGCILKNKKVIKILFTNIKNEKDTYNYAISDYINKTLDYLSIKTTKQRQNFFDYILVNKYKKNKYNSNIVKSNLDQNINLKNVFVRKFSDNNLLHDVKKIYNFIYKL